jgi:hypothetical protein
MKWWLIVFLLTANGWEPGENFDGWWASEQVSFEACEEHRDFANKTNSDTSLADKICFACEQRFDDGTPFDSTCEGPCEPCQEDEEKSSVTTNP